MTEPHTPDCPALVLDTNVVLDWLLFADPRIATLAAAIHARQVRWLACPRMRDELEHTLHRPALAQRQPDPAALLAAFDQHAVMLQAPPSHPRLRCDDPDDQVFVDLALASRAQALLSHDRAVLRLRRRAATLGLVIARPWAWQQTAPA